MPTDQELIDRGMKVFRGMVSRAGRQLCTRRIARDRYCPRPARKVGSLYCTVHWREVEEEDRQFDARYPGAMP